MLFSLFLHLSHLRPFCLFVCWCSLFRRTVSYVSFSEFPKQKCPLFFKCVVVYIGPFHNFPFSVFPFPVCPLPDLSFSNYHFFKCVFPRIVLFPICPFQNCHVADLSFSNLLFWRSLLVFCFIRWLLFSNWPSFTWVPHTRSILGGKRFKYWMEGWSHMYKYYIHQDINILQSSQSTNSLIFLNLIDVFDCFSWSFWFFFLLMYFGVFGVFCTINCYFEHFIGFCVFFCIYDHILKI